MKTLLLFLLSIAHFSQVCGQISSRPGGKDTASKSKPSGIPGITNTVTGPYPNNNIAGSTNVTTPPPQPLTLEELNKKVASLEQQVIQLQNKISFADFNMIHYEVKPEDLTLSDNPSVKYKPEIRINDPLCNNRPDIKLFVQSGDGINVTSIYKQGYWYLRTPPISYLSILQYGMTDYYTVGSYQGTLLNKNVPFDYIVEDGGLLAGRYYSPNVGNRFLIIVYSELPKLNPALMQRPQGVQ